MNEKQLILELNSLLIRRNLEDWEQERVCEIEELLIELQDMSYEALSEINE
jgi:hypothetical protein